MKERLVTGVLAGGVFVTLLLLGGYWFLGLVLLLAIVGMQEFARMIGMTKILPLFIAYMGMLGLTIPWEHWDHSLPLESFLWLTLFALFCVTVILKNQVTIDHAALFFAAVVYLGLGFHYMASTRWSDSHGLIWTMLVFFCIWATDSGAYFLGKAFGKHLLWPTISPKKTVEGALGGLVVSILVALVFSWLQPDVLGIPKALLLGAVIGVVGQMGDLIQSAYKRVKGIKDTGAILPGHGGVLDRVDSWLIVFPFLHMVGLLH